MERYEIADMPGLGAVLLNMDRWFGYRELFRADKELVYYRGVPGKSAYDAVNEIVDLNGGFLKGWGRRKALKKMRNRASMAKIYDFDISFLEKVMEGKGLVEKAIEYDRLLNVRRCDMARKNFFSRRLSRPETKAMTGYRTENFPQVFDALEQACISKSTEGGELAPIYTAIANEYARLREMFGDGSGNPPIALHMGRLHTWATRKREEREAKEKKQEEVAIATDTLEDSETKYRNDGMPENRWQGDPKLRARG